MGLLLLKNSGLASFWSPAKRKVTPRNSRRGMSTQPAFLITSGGGRHHGRVPQVEGSPMGAL